MEIKVFQDRSSNTYGLCPFIFTFLDTLFDKYKPKEPKIFHNLLLGLDKNESKVHFTKENFDG